MNVTRPRTRSGRCVGVVGLVALTAVAAAWAPPVQAQPATGHTDRANVRTGGFAAGSGNVETSSADGRLISANGRYMVYASSTPVVPGQKPLSWQIIRRDRKLGVTELVSVARKGGLANGRSGSPSISSDGRYVAWTSDATNLVAGDTNDSRDIFVRDMQAKRTTRVSVSSSGAQAAPNSNSVAPSISATGRHVAFLSTAGNLSPDSTTSTQAYLHDRVTGVTEVVSRTAAGVAASATAGSRVSVSQDGNRVLFVSLDADIAPGAHNLDLDVFVRDRAAGATLLVVQTEEGSHDAVLSADGSSVAYVSSDPDIAGPAPQRQVYHADLATGVQTRVSTSSAGATGNDRSETPAISANGRYVAFQSTATNLVPGDTNDERDIFLHDVTTGSTVRASVGSPGGQQSTRSSTDAIISADGRHVGFASHDASLRAGASSSWNHAYVRDLDSRWSVMTAKVKKFKKKANRKKTLVIRTQGIGAGQKLRVVVTPLKGVKGKKVVHTPRVVNNRVKVKMPKRKGRHRVQVSYVGQKLRIQKVMVR
jgi:Tol biopolymer transport system component